MASFHGPHVFARIGKGRTWGEIGLAGGSALVWNGGGMIVFPSFLRPLGGLILALACVAPASAEDPAVPGPSPVQVQGTRAAILVENVVQSAPEAPLLVRFAFPEGPVAPVLSEEQTGPAATLLRRLYAAGRASGNHGDLYDNRDRGHSTLPDDWFPQLTRITYGPRLRANDFDYGAALRLIFGAPVIGNSSTALTSGPLWRSQPRFMLTTAGGAGRLFRHYLAGQIHVYPEHRDHDPEYGDLMPANTPYYLISQGSSGSDRPHLEALVMILAAFRPDTKAMLYDTGLLASTVQMVYRRSRDQVLSRADYLSGAAHPSVFDPGGIVLGRMVALANAIAPDAVPPMVRLTVEEDFDPGADPGLPEQLFDTPSAIARIWRSGAGRREMVVSAAETVDPNGRDLDFTWVLLRGDPARVRIEPLAPDGRRARIVLDWQAPRPVPGLPELQSARIDIGVFADNGVHPSAPAFLSVLLPAHERRVYDTGPDGVPRMIEIARDPAEGIYVDPALFPPGPERAGDR